MKVSTVDIEQFRNTKFFTLTPHRWGNRKKIADPTKHGAYIAQLAREIEDAKARKEGRAPNLSQVAADVPTGKTADTSKTSVSATKRLLVSEPLDALNTHLTQTKADLCGVFGLAQQSRVLKGLYVVADGLIETIEAKIKAAQHQLYNDRITPDGEVLPGYLPAFMTDLPAAIERTRDLPLLQGGLGPLWEARDYAGLEDQLRDAFSIESQWLALGIPEDLPPALKAAAAEKFEKQLTEAAEECKDALRCSLGKFLDNLVDRLTPGDDGKPKIFRDSLIENVRQFCEVFDARNFLKDTELANLVQKCRTILDDKTLDAEKIRKYSSVRENTAKQFSEIKSQLDGMIETRKARTFDLSDE